MVELVIAMGILSVGLVGAMRVFPVGLRASQRAEMSSRAAIIAQRTIESLKLKPWDQLQEAQTDVEEEGFQVTTNISRPTVEHLVDPTQLKAVQVSVRAKEGGGHAHELTFVTYLWREPSSS